MPFPSPLRSPILKEAPLHTRLKALEIQFWVFYCLWKIASYMELSVAVSPQNSVHTKLSSSSLHHILYLPLQCLLKYASSITWHSKLVLSLFFIPHTQINQESLSYSNSIISLLCFPFGKHCLVQDSEQLPGVASVSLSPTSSTARLSYQSSLNHSEKPSVAAYFLPFKY